MAVARPMGVGAAWMRLVLAPEESVSLGAVQPDRCGMRKIVTSRKFIFTVVLLGVLLSMYVPQLVSHSQDYLDDTRRHFGNTELSTFHGKVVAENGWLPGFPRELFIVHIAASLAAMLLACLQALPFIRRNHPALHRKMGLGYVLAVPIGAGAGAFVGQYSFAGLSVQMGYAFSSAVWIAFTLVAYGLGRRGRYIEHRDWMIRSMCMLLASPVERLFLFSWVYVVSNTGMTYVTWRAVTIWVSIAIIMGAGQLIVMYLHGNLRRRPLPKASPAVVAGGSDRV